MIPLVNEYGQAVRTLCEKFHVRRLELFGSAARGEFDPTRSDLDFFVEFENLGWKGSFKRYMGLKIALEELFAHSVDLVEFSAITSPHFREIAAKHRELLYAA